jgi:hypothetical protein
MNDRVISCLNNIKDENDLSAEGKKKIEKCPEYVPDKKA